MRSNRYPRPGFLPASAVCWAGALVPLLLALVLVAVGARAEDDETCRRLRSIVNEWQSDFADLAGDSIGEDEWNATAALPGQARCLVRKSRSISYICESDPYDNPAQAEAAASAALDKAEKCLGKSWTRPGPLSPIRFSLTDDENARAIIWTVGPAISPEPQFVVETSIYRMHQQAMEAEVKTPADFKGQAYCAALKAVVASGSSGFEGLIRGSTPERIETRTHWRSGVELPGWEDCWVHQDGSDARCRYLACKRGPFIDLKEASSAVTATAAEVGACLGDGWSVARARQSDGTPKERVLGPKEQAYVEIRPSESLYSSGWNVKLDVMRDFEVCD